MKEGVGERAVPERGGEVKKVWSKRGREGRQKVVRGKEKEDERKRLRKR